MSLSRRVDLHCHFLPGVDDGAGSLEESVELARVAVADGTRAALLTPHVRADFLTEVGELPDRVAELRAALRRARVPLEVHGAGEVGHEMVGRLSQGELEIVAAGPPGARWILLETPFEGLDSPFHQAAGELRLRGFEVVMAHPERSRGLLEDGALDLRDQLDQGSLVQVNAGSLTGGYGADAEWCATALVFSRRADVIASDAHPGWRTPRLTPALAALRRRGLGPNAARALTEGMPAGLLYAGLRVPTAV